MRALVLFFMRRMMRSGVGRWTLTILLLLIGAIAFAAYPGVAASQSQQDGLVALGTGIFFTLLGLFTLFVTLRVGSMTRRARSLQAQSLSRINELKASGQLLVIPALPPAPQGIAPERIRQVDEYAQRMKGLPWGQQPRVAPAEAVAVMDRTIAQVRGIRGDWSKLSGPIDTFVSLPAPYCYVGAAEVMHRLSYLQGYSFAPNGLQQGLKFIASAQFTEPMQPDALVIRVKLLAGSSAKRWLELADQTLDLLRRFAPDHLRLPDAEAAIHLKRGEFEAALICMDRLIARPPSPEEGFAAQAQKASALWSLKRNDEALAAFDSVLEMNPNDAWVWHNRSILLQEMGRLPEALESNARALTIMDFGVARERRQIILAKLAEAGAPRSE